ncbi:MAG: helix-turn-helix transcriptional regulator [Microcoleus sp. PH2017_10_PVI_O_A]|uniref:helix-turn-helix domain-containing protein n=1 Tax=unclassified Microcoleus TaxID=2642155 RepID=UPI001D4E53A1|nr:MULTISPECIES: helix-turn-helix transcriptional regulator [unclassified Microcoleus]TAE85423.1 MAG: XRE family transcriptional regulator [Oscillatoriales cyanobacterium]MCC3404720.1 helix-turn-helix transcriptional regulator [Microcoleus sp. PH2017_10_PVI_O_A]MCC3458741.1 helix-turn-helix transcriptional regulator [Microcoleus sp. PH2017_11_PCY_U_A]MCC3477504.1 helix-turn-helix transcriptional regulator [Microcoleus sp. PH2017_12_PCY_D_A]MCC3527190.1 helix-turn-helix transcriptional regulato
MGKAGKALRQILEAYEISQYQLAAKMEIDRSNVSRWVSEERDPSAEAVFAINKALQTFNPQAASEFVRLYLGNDPKDG